MLTVVPGEGSGHEGGKKDGAATPVDQIVREGARRMLAEAPQAGVGAYAAVPANGRVLELGTGTARPPRCAPGCSVIPASPALKSPGQPG